MVKFCSLLLLCVVSISAYAERSVFYHFDFGTWFGGDKLAQNPSGDDYKAGSGALLGLGLDWQFNKEHQIFFRNNIGYRYQGAKTGSGGNRGIVYETALGKQIGQFNLVGGLHLDLEAVTKDQYGNRMEYDNAVGPYIGLEHMTFGNWGFGIKYLIQDYKLSNGTEVSGNVLVKPNRTLSSEHFQS